MRHGIKVGLVTFVLSMSLTAQVTAGLFENRFESTQRGDDAKAIRLSRPLADQGDASACFNLGVMYDEGQRVPQVQPWR